MKRTVIIGGAGIIIAAGVGAAVVFHRTQSIPFETVAVVRGTVARTVIVTGTVVPERTIDLAFEQSGTLATITVDEGSPVAVGMPLASLDTREIDARIAEANATLASSRAQSEQYRATKAAEEARLRELERGSRPEEIALARTKKLNAEKSSVDARQTLAKVEDIAAVVLENLYSDTQALLRNAYANAESAVSFLTDSMFVDANSDYPKLSFVTTDTVNKTRVESLRPEARGAGMNIATVIATAGLSDTDRAQAMVVVAQDLEVIRQYIDVLGLVVNASFDVNETTRETYQSNIKTARVAIYGSLADIHDHQQVISSQIATNQKNILDAQAAVTTAESAIAVATDELNILIAGASDEELAAQRSRIEQATATVRAQQAGVAQAQARLDSLITERGKMTLIAPISGVITDVFGEIGETVGAGSPVLSLISDAALQGEIAIPESSIADITIGAPVTVTLDAYGPDAPLRAVVTKIEPAARQVEGVQTYLTLISFEGKDDRVRVGMTADCTIQGPMKDQVLLVPLRAITYAAGQPTVRVLRTVSENASDSVVVPVATGIVGSDGMVEIVEGLREGEQIVIFN